jgi:hypothetical protein
MDPRRHRRWPRRRPDGRPHPAATTTASAARCTTTERLSRRGRPAVDHPGAGQPARHRRRPVSGSVAVGCSSTRNGPVPHEPRYFADGDAVLVSKIKWLILSLGHITVQPICSSGYRQPIFRWASPQPFRSIHTVAGAGWKRTRAPTPNAGLGASSRGSARRRASRTTISWPHQPQLGQRLSEGWTTPHPPYGGISPLAFRNRARSSLSAFAPSGGV